MAVSLIGPNWLHKWSVALLASSGEHVSHYWVLFMGAIMHFERLGNWNMAQVVDIFRLCMIDGPEAHYDYVKFNYVGGELTPSAWQSQLDKLDEANKPCSVLKSREKVLADRLHNRLTASTSRGLQGVLAILHRVLCEPATKATAAALGIPEYHTAFQTRNSQIIPAGLKKTSDLPDALKAFFHWLPYYHAGENMSVCVCIRLLLCTHAHAMRCAQ